MEKPSLSKQALARIKAAKEEAGADLLNGLVAFWSDIGMNTSALSEHDPGELMHLFERYAEKLFDARAEELLPHFPDAEAYANHLILLPMETVVGICPSAFVTPENILATDWKELYRALLSDMKKSGRPDEAFQQLSGDWEMYVDHSFSRQFLKGRLTSAKPDRDSAQQGLMPLFRLKYLFHLRLFANYQRFIQRVCTHLSERLHRWRAKAYHRLAGAPAEEGKTELVFKNPPRAWRDIELVFVTPETLEIKNRNEVQNCSFRDLGFGSRKPDRLWRMLREFADARGRLYHQRATNPRQAQIVNRQEKAVADLRGNFQKFFDISNDPFPLIDGVYESQFASIRSEIA